MIGTETQSDEFITREEAARRLGCGNSTLSGYLRRGMLTRYKKADGYFVRLKASEVEELRQRLSSWLPSS